tara:strand:- start:378 stop:656 length:279 start_codon:yes stop_codon:yes gene_type:complete
MKITTAIEFLRAKSNKRKIQEMEDLKELLIQASKGMLNENNFTIGNVTETDMDIEIRNIFFDIDGRSFTNWLNENCETENESDKWITIKNLR